MYSYICQNNDCKRKFQRPFKNMMFCSRSCYWNSKKGKDPLPIKTRVWHNHKAVESPAVAPSYNLSYYLIAFFKIMFMTTCAIGFLAIALTCGPLVYAITCISLLVFLVLALLHRL